MKQKSETKTVRFSLRTKRGDTVIEVMFAVAIFALVAVLSIALMNAGVISGERSLELTTVRNEINAQAEALRFIHSSYVAELTLPVCSGAAGDTRCQQFASLWQRITNNAVSANTIPSPVESCEEIYQNNNQLLRENHAFVINARRISYINNGGTGSDALDNIYIAANGGTMFQPAVISSRIVYVAAGASYSGNEANTSAGDISSTPVKYVQVGSVEGVWVVAVAGDHYYDFYIQSCWYAPNSSMPNSIDTVIRLYNPEG